VAAVAQKVGDIDEYDVLASVRLKDWPAKQSGGIIDLTLDEYVNQRRSETAQSICSRYLDSAGLAYRLGLLELSLIRLLLFLKYPVKSFSMTWDRELRLIAALQSEHDSCRERLEAFQKYHA
jgi:hypothetical protein